MERCGLVDSLCDLMRLSYSSILPGLTLTVTKRDWRPSAMAWTRRDTRPEAWRDERRYGRLVSSDRELECALATLIRGRTLAVGARRVWARARTNVDPPVVKALWTKADIVLDARVSGACEVRGKADSVEYLSRFWRGSPARMGKQSSAGAAPVMAKKRGKMRHPKLHSRRLASSPVGIAPRGGSG